MKSVYNAKTSSEYIAIGTVSIANIGRRTMSISGQCLVEAGPTSFLTTYLAMAKDCSEGIRISREQ